MPKIRVDAEPITLSSEDIRRSREGLFIENAITFTMPLIKGMKVDQTKKIISELTQPVRLRRNFDDKSQYHLKLTRFNEFTITVPVVLAEIEDHKSKPSSTSFSIGCE